MKNNLGLSIILAFVYVFIQVTFLNSLNIFGLINPKIFIIFLLLLPRSIPISYLLIIGFMYGFIVDYFSMTLGLNMASCVFIVFIREYVLKLIYNKPIDEEPIISVANQGKLFVGRYIFIMTLIFCLFYFSIEAWSFSNIFYITLKSILSTVFTLVLYLIFVLLYLDNSKSNTSKY